MAEAAKDEILEPTLTLDEQQAEMDAAAALLIGEYLFPAEIFNVEAAMLDGHSFKPFLEMVRLVAALEEDDILAEALWKGTIQGFWVLPNLMKRPNFVAFACWLQSEEGDDFVYGLKKLKRKEKRKASATVTSQEITFQEVFDQMRAKFAAEHEAKRVELDREIADVERKLRILRREKEEKLEDIKNKYEPASSYEEQANAVENKRGKKK